METIAFCTRLKRPGCILLQSAMGATIPSAKFQWLFPTDTWLVGGEEGFDVSKMKVYPVTDDQLMQLVDMAKNAVRK